MATYTVGGRGARSGSGSVFVSNAGTKNSLMNRIMESGMGSLSSGEQASARSLMNPDEFASVTGRGAAPGTSTGTGATTGTGGGIDANSLMELYQKGLGAGEAKNMSTDDQIKLLREGNAIDMESRRQQQQLQLEGQEKVLSQTQQARARERETEATLQRRQQSNERSNAMAAYKSL
jgi:hypothetical protein